MNIEIWFVIFFIGSIVFGGLSILFAYLGDKGTKLENLWYFLSVNGTIITIMFIVYWLWQLKIYF